MPAVLATAPAGTPAPSLGVRFVNMVEPQQRVTLPGIQEQGPDGAPLYAKRGIPAYRVIQFQPRRVGIDEYGNPRFFGYYSPKDEQELAELRRLCAMGLCRAREEDERLQEAVELIREQSALQAAAGR